MAIHDLPVDDPPWQALAPSQCRRLTLDGLKRLLVRESQVRPVLLIVENLHWIDAETQAFLIGEEVSLAPLHQHLIEKTEGNPCFLEESIRTLVETQGLVGAPGAYRLAHAVRNLRVPATVQAVLAARIDALVPEDKRLLQMAAVMGTEVLFALLRALAEQSDEVLQTGLSHLQATEFLYETSLFPELTYTFGTGARFHGECSVANGR
jgi:predicted ATPase